MITGYYYLHTNGELIYKRYLDDEQVADFRESDFVVQFWPVDPEDREGAWTILIGALAAGANRDRVMELARKWQCDNRDAEIMAQRIGCEIVQDSIEWHAHRINQEPIGKGSTALDAFANLLKALGYKPQKTWGKTLREWMK